MRTLSLMRMDPLLENMLDRRKGHPWKSKEPLQAQHEKDKSYFILLTDIWCRDKGGGGITYPLKYVWGKKIKNTVIHVFVNYALILMCIFKTYFHINCNRSCRQFSCINKYISSFSKTMFVKAARKRFLCIVF